MSTAAVPPEEVMLLRCTGAPGRTLLQSAGRWGFAEKPSIGLPLALARCATLALALKYLSAKARWELQGHRPSVGVAPNSAAVPRPSGWLATSGRCAQLRRGEVAKWLATAVNRHAIIQAYCRSRAPQVVARGGGAVAAARWGSGDWNKEGVKCWVEGGGGGRGI